MKLDGTDPRRTIKLLNELEELGFNNVVFKMLHHKGKSRETISTHRNWCANKRLDPFQPFHEKKLDWQVQRRLEFVLREFKILSAEDLRDETAIEILRRLAKASLEVIPIQPRKR
jgi:hypothetical protein